MNTESINQRLLPTVPTITQPTIIWMVLAYLVINFGQIVRQPIWLAALFVVCCVWRLLIMSEKMHPLGRIGKFVLVVFGFMAIGFGYGQGFGLDSTVALFLLAGGFKIVESRFQRDVQVVIILCWMMLGIEGLYTQSLIMIPYLLIASWITVQLMLSMNQPHQQDIQPEFSNVSKQLILVIPLFIILFFIFPRLGPLWNVDMANKKSYSGLSDNMSPGDVADLTQSTEKVFRAKFLTPAPNRNQLYWRSFELENYNGTTWSRNRRSREYLNDITSNEELAKYSKLVEYEILMEPNGKRHLYSLDYPISIDGANLRFDSRVASDIPVLSQKLYKVVSTFDGGPEPFLDDMTRQINLNIPLGLNPRTEALAQTMGRQGPLEIIAEMNRKFNEWSMTYTLKPGTMSGSNQVDQLLFETRKGFCLHYAGAMVYFLRAAGHPARMVAGYQGGEWNSGGDYYSIYQYDAHGWVEVWIEGKGWWSFDPTAWIAPNRIEQGLRAAVSDESFLSDIGFSTHKYSDSQWLVKLRMTYDELNFAWQYNALNYSQAEQKQWVKNIFGDLNIRMVYLLLIAISLAIVAIILLALLRNNTKNETYLANKVYIKLLDRLEKRLGESGFKTVPPNQLADHLGHKFPQARSQLEQIMNMYSAIQYGSVGGYPDQNQLRLFKKRVKNLRRQLGV